MNAPSHALVSHISFTFHYFPLTKQFVCQLLDGNGKLLYASIPTRSRKVAWVEAAKWYRENLAETEVIPCDR